MGRIMKQLGRVAIVFFIVFSILIAQRNELFAQSSSTGTNVSGNPATNSAAKTNSAKWLAARLSVLPPAGLSTPATDAASAPQASTSAAKKYGLWAGLALTGVGLALVLRDEPVHQTTCITYDACPTPGLVQMSGGIMIGVGVPLAIFALKH